jgi:hypothetical protein
MSSNRRRSNVKTREPQEAYVRTWAEFVTGRTISPSRCVCSSIFSSSVSVRVRKRASAGQARWTLKTGQIKLSILPAGCTGCH